MRLNYLIFFSLTCIIIAHGIVSCDDFLNNPKTKVYPDYTGQIDSVYDIDGNLYKTIGIGSQIWMAQNLKTTKLNDGTIIPQVKSDSIWDYNPQVAFCWYNNDTVYNKKIYGALYNFYTVNTGLLCPVGWHVPKNSDWRVLVDFLGGSETAGGNLKDYYTPYWSDPNRCIVNNYRFLALPGGLRSHYKGRFININSNGSWWTSTPKNQYDSYSWMMYNSETSIGNNQTSIGDGLSVRCIKD